MENEQHHEPPPGTPIDLAPLRLALPDRRIVVVEGATTATTLADIAVAAGLLPARSVEARIVVDGAASPGSQRLLHSGVCWGSRLAVASTAGEPPPERAVASAVWVRGADAGGRVVLGPVTHYIGRARTARVRCNDPALELHHAVLHIGADGSAVIDQLAGLHPVAVDGVAIDGPTTVHPGARIELGASVVVVRRIDPVVGDPALGDAALGDAALGDEVGAAVVGDAVAASAATAPAGSRGSSAAASGWRAPWVRSPRPRTPFEPMPIQAPQPAAPAPRIQGGLLPAAIGVLGSALMALLFDQLMFLLFGAMGAFVAFGTWLAQRVGLIRSRRSVGSANRTAMERFVAALTAQRDECRRSLLAHANTLDRAVATMTNRTSDLWGVRADDADAFRAAIGEGDCSWQPLVTGPSDGRRDLWSAIETASRLGTGPVLAGLGDGAVVGLVGEADATSVARSLVVQLAASSGPADWRLAVVSDRVDEWAGLEWLPHLINDSANAASSGGITACVDAAAMIAALDPTDSRHMLLVLDGAQLLTARTGPVRRLLAGAASVACVVVCPTEAEVPAICTSALIIGRLGRARWIADSRLGALADTVHIAGLSIERTFDACAAIACLTDPEHVDPASALPGTVGMSELLAPDIGTDPAAFAQRISAGWRGRGTDPAPITPLGVAADGVIEIDLGRDGPHALLAGTTGSGKSELLRSLVVGLAVRCSPEHVTFVLIDYKGGSAFDACAALPHTVGLVTDLDDRLAARALRSLEAELRRREALLRSVGASDLSAYRAALSDGSPTAPLPRLVVVIDEFASLAVQQPDFISALLGVAQLGRSLGVHLLLATQRPTGVISDDIRANTNIRIALRVQDAADSTDVIGDAAAAYFPRSVPGRAIMRLGTDDRVGFQTASCTLQSRRARPGGGLVVRTRDAGSAWSSNLGVGANSGPELNPEMSPATSADPQRRQRPALAVLVDAIRQAARLSDIAVPHRPWLDPLSIDMTLDSLPAGLGRHADRDANGDPIVGIVDDPDHQTRRPLTWPAASGHLLLVGSPGSGTTTALIELARTVDADESVAGRELFVIDANGDAGLDALRELATCAAIVRLHERERLLRVFEHLCSMIDGRRVMLGDGGAVDHSGHDVVVMIDGLAALRAGLEGAEQWAQLEQLDRIVGEGVGAGIRVVMTTERPGAVPSAMLGHFGIRWVFHLADPLEAGVLGLSRASVPPAVPGRLFDTASMREAQLVRAQRAPRPGAGPTPTPVPRRAGPTSALLLELAADIELAMLSDAVAEGGDVLAPIGTAFDDLRPAVLPIASGEHVLVIGPARSGRTTVLHTITDRWTTANDGGWVGAIAARRSSARPGATYGDVATLLAAMPDDRAVLVVIDDAELVDDSTGELSARISARREDFTVLAAGRGDSLRASYGHWTTAVRKSRLGLVMAAANELDGDLLGVTLPRRLPIPARAGLAWLVADGGRRLVQVARASCGAEVAAPR